MKNILTALCLFTLFISAAFLAGCKKEDTTLPIISLNGTNPMLISLNSTVADPGASAKDDKDGELVVTSDWNASSTPNENYVGTYIVTYTAKDKSDNEATVQRVVIVRNDAYFLAGNYHTVEGINSWNQAVTASMSENNMIIFSRFANYNNNNTIKALLGAGNQVDLPLAETGIGTLGCQHLFTPGGPGNPLSWASGPITFSIKFSDEEIAVDVTCPGSAPINQEDFFTRLD